MPDLSLEQALSGRVAGVDEVGRGPWAGPVVAAAAWIDPARIDPALLAALTDSKMLSRVRRRRLAEALADDEGVAVAVGVASVTEIAARNVLGATFLAMGRAVESLSATVSLDHLLIDGSQLPVGAGWSATAHAVVGGDRHSQSIAAASIVAKVFRDRLMVDLSERFPGYGWEHNAGYGTREHRAALARLGVTPEHRAGFKPIRALLEGVPPLLAVGLEPGAETDGETVSPPT